MGLAACAGLPTYSAAPIGENLILNRAEIELALGERQALRIKAAGWGEDVLLIKGAEGEIHGVGMTCSHLGCQVRPGGNFLVCPCHGSTFDLRGDVVRGPAQKSLSRYDVELSPGEITIRADRERI